jgi:hypothetical protein
MDGIREPSFERSQGFHRCLPAGLAVGVVDPTGGAVAQLDHGLLRGGEYRFPQFVGEFDRAFGVGEQLVDGRIRPDRYRDSGTGEPESSVSSLNYPPGG